MCTRAADGTGCPTIGGECEAPFTAIAGVCGGRMQEFTAFGGKYGASEVAFIAVAAECGANEIEFTAVVRKCRATALTFTAVADECGAIETEFTAGAARCGAVAGELFAEGCPIQHLRLLSAAGEITDEPVSPLRSVTLRGLGRNIQWKPYNLNISLELTLRLLSGIVLPSALHTFRAILTRPGGAGGRSIQPRQPRGIPIAVARSSAFLIAYNFNSLSLPGFLAQAQRVVTGMTANPQFPEPWPSSVPPLAQINADLTSFANAYAATAGGDQARIADRNKARAALANDLQQLGLYVEMTANGDDSLLATSGFDLRSRQVPVMVPTPLPSPENLRLQRGEVSGLLIARVKSLPKAASYDVQITTADPTVETNWTSAGTFSTCRRIELSGLTPMKTYSVRVRGISSAGPGAWTLPSSLTVL